MIGLAIDDLRLTRFADRCARTEERRTSPKSNIVNPGGLLTAAEMGARTKSYSLRVLKLVHSLPQNRACDILGGQLLRAGTSVGANYRAVCRAKSLADFINKLRIVEEECDESLLWMELLVEAGFVKNSRLANLQAEGDEILSIIVSSTKTARASHRVSIVNRPS